MAVGGGCGGEASRHPHTLARELADHFAKGGVFAAHLGYRPDTYCRERHDEQFAAVGMGSWQPP